MDKYMERALELARISASDGEVPVGAVIVRKSTGEIIGEGRNMRELHKNALAHAEIIAINQACKNSDAWRLDDCALYVTLEPCPMCCGAIINSRISAVYFGAFDKKAGSVESRQSMFSMGYNHRPDVYSGIMEDECSEILSDFFGSLRKKNRKTLDISQKI